MRICLYTDTALPKLGGQEWVVDALARQYLALGQEPVVLAPHPRLPLRAQDGVLPYQVVRHPRFYSTRFFVAWYRWFLRRLYRRSPFSILHCHGIYPPAYLAALNRDILDAPVLITSHGGDVYEGSTRLAKPVLKERYVQGLRAADAWIAISRFTREGFLRLCPEPLRIVDIPNGVDLAPFAEAVPRPHDLDPAIQPGRYALFLGRLKDRKGVDLLLSALALTKVDRKTDRAVQLVIAGEGEERPRLEAQCAALGLNERVRFVGKSVGAQKMFLLQNALFGVAPSRTWEAFPLVVLEHYAAGLPVVATRTPGLEDLVRPGVTGELVAAESAKELAKALGMMFTRPEHVRRLGAQAQEWAQSFSWSNIARQHIRLYEELLDTRTTRAKAG
ncbi:MAG: glycosyltransferase family 4 protein [Gemmataceae bacterium]|nr:glycosyltransferase family 4 protein [Gemmataceae bacterium]MCI0739766.1 glycosyltransferase family 4 protein [Gemmataceae bacterium]